jgi:hypothetical protein
VTCTKKEKEMLYISSVHDLLSILSVLITKVFSSDQNRSITHVDITPFLKFKKVICAFSKILGKSKNINLRAMAAGKINPMQTVAVAPVNWKASQMLGIKFAPKKTSTRSPLLMNANLRLSETKGLAEVKRRPSKLRRNG